MTRLYAQYALPSAPGKGESVYRVLSGFAHGKQWSALLGVLTRNGALEHDPEHPTARFSSSDTLTLFAGRCTMSALTVALDEIAAYTATRPDSDA